LEIRKGRGEAEHLNSLAGSDEGGRRAAAIYTLIASAKLNDIDPQAWCRRSGSPAGSPRQVH
jgi:transposase